MYRLRLKMAAVGFTVLVESPFASALTGAAYPGFVGDDHREELEVTIRGHYLAAPGISLENAALVFESGAHWDVYNLEGSPAFAVKSPHDPHAIPARIAVFSPDYRQGDVYYHTPSPERQPHLPDPLEHPILSLLMTSLLAQGYGVIMHGCGVDDHGRGLLFTGSSGQGKSTMANLWHGEAAVLNDERVVLRQHQGRLWIFGTPWHGDYERFAAHGVPLERVYFLKQAAENRAVPQATIRTIAARLASHCFLPAWNTAGMNFILSFCGQVATGPPCYDLGFVPDKRIVDFIRSHA